MQTLPRAGAGEYEVRHPSYLPGELQRQGVVAMKADSLGTPKQTQDGLAGSMPATSDLGTTMPSLSA